MHTVHCVRLCRVPHAVQETQGEYMARIFGMDVFCFGICHEGGKKYNAFLYPEGYNSGNSECVISMLQRFFEGNPDMNGVRTCMCIQTAVLVKNATTTGWRSGYLVCLMAFTRWFHGISLLLGTQSSVLIAFWSSTCSGEEV